MTISSIKTGTVSEFRLGYRPELDALRGIAAVLVFLNHTNVPGFRGGFMGVDIFFGLSGFLITLLLLEEFRDRAMVDVRKFFIRRFRRLLPAFAVFCGICLVLSIIRFTGPKRKETVESLVSSVLYVRNWFQIATNKGVDGFAQPHLWSLAVEEQFYVVWPLVFGLALKFLSKRLVLVGAGVLWCLSLGVALLVNNGNQNQPRQYLGTDVRGAQILGGVVLAIGLHYGWIGLLKRWWQVIVLLVPIPLLLAWSNFRAAQFFDFYYGGGIAVVGFVVAGLLWAAISLPGGVKRLASFGPIKLLGSISYSFYLWHVFALNVLSPNSEFHFEWLYIDRWIVRTVAAFGLSVGIALLSQRFVERPASRWFKSANIRPHR